MAHQHNKDCEELRAARDALRAQVRPPNTEASQAGARFGSHAPLESAASGNVEQELATVEKALRDAGCED